MMLDRILDAIAGAGGGALSLGQLSAAVGVEIEALAPMLDLLVRRGLLSDSALSRSMACGGGCGVACDPGSCAFVVAVPPDPDHRRPGGASRLADERGVAASRSVTIGGPVAPPG